MRRILWQTLLAPLKIPGMLWSPVRIEWAACTQSKATRQRFSHRMLRELLKAGWHEGRKLAHEELAQMYREPFDFFSAQAMQILEEFGGLRIGESGAVLKSHQNGDAAKTVSELLGSQLCPFGVTFYYCDTSGLWVDEQGRIFATIGANDSSKTGKMTLEYVAGSFVQALEILAAGSKAPSWPDPSVNDRGVWHFIDD